MDHRLVAGIEAALGWTGPDGLGTAFARGTFPDSGFCAQLLTPTKLLDLVMRRSLASHRLRFLVDGRDLHPQYYLGMSTARRGQAVPMADMRRIGQLLKSGCTLIVDEANTYDPALEIACRALQWWSHELVQVNIYLTTGDAAGFQLHWDDHDVVIVQLAGEKNWEVRSLSRPVPMYRDATPNPDPPDEIVWAGTMCAGDVMHIPRGYWHQATRQSRGEGYSLHVTFGFPKRTGVDWFLWAADQSRRNELFRHDLLRWASVEEQYDQQDALTDAAIHLLATRPFAEFLDARAQERSVARHVATHSVFGRPSAVVCVTEFQPSMEICNEQIIVRAAGKEVTFTGKAEEALRQLLSGRPAMVDAVTESTGLDVAALADVLIAEDICAEATPELIAGYSGLLIPPAQ